MGRIDLAIELEKHGIKFNDDAIDEILSESLNRILEEKKTSCGEKQVIKPYDLTKIKRRQNGSVTHVVNYNICRRHDYEDCFDCDYPHCWRFEPREYDTPSV